jgi:hypothetical protein
MAIKMFATFRGKGQCAYEEWDKEAKKLRLCGKVAVILSKEGIVYKGLCAEHADFLLSESAECRNDESKPKDKSPNYMSCSPAVIRKIITASRD